MRVLVVDTYYPAFTAAHYAERPDLADAPYAEQLASLMARRFGTSDAYSRGLQAAGHDAEEVIVNVGPLQHAWAREHRVFARRTLATASGVPTRIGSLAATALQHRVAFAQIRAYRPDVVYLQDLWFFARRELGLLRRMTGALIVGQIASEPPPPDRLRGFDLVLTSFPHYVERFRALGVDSEYLAIAFDEQLASLVDTSVDAPRPHGAVFVGGVNPRVHPAGTALLERLCERVDLEVWGYGRDDLPAGSPLRERHRGEAWGLDMYRVLARSKVVVNRHIEAAEGFANNMRLFEATGSGAALVTEAAPNLGELFDPEREVATYTCEQELVRRIEALLADDAARRSLAAAGQARTLAEHTYTRRMFELAAILERYRR